MMGFSGGVNITYPSKPEAFVRVFFRIGQRKYVSCIFRGYYFVNEKQILLHPVVDAIQRRL